MDVHVPKSGDEELPASVDDFRASANGNTSTRLDRLNDGASEENRLVRHDHAGLNVNHIDAMNRHGWDAVCGIVSDANAGAQKQQDDQGNMSHRRSPRKSVSGYRSAQSRPLRIYRAECLQSVEARHKQTDRLRPKAAGRRGAAECLKWSKADRQLNGGHGWKTDSRLWASSLALALAGRRCADDPRQDALAYRPKSLKAPKVQRRLPVVFRRSRWVAYS